MTLALEGRVAVITGGAGLLGAHHARAIARAGGVPILLDLREQAAQEVAAELHRETGVRAIALQCDVTDQASVRKTCRAVLHECGRVDILVNNAANNPRVESGTADFVRLEQMTRERWDADLAVGLTGAFLCAQVFGEPMAARRQGVIVNISSEYGVIAPDQRLYEQPGAGRDDQPAKPASYTVVKAGLHGLTMYLATYWSSRGVRANTLVVGGVHAGQSDEFVARASARVPLGRMAAPNDFEGALVFLCSDASSFMTGASLVIDGGKTTW